MVLPINSINSAHTETFVQLDSTALKMNLTHKEVSAIEITCESKRLRTFINSN